MLGGLLDDSARETNRKMIGWVPPRERLLRRLAAGLLLAAIVGAFALVFRTIARVFTPPDAGLPGHDAVGSAAAARLRAG